MIQLITRSAAIFLLTCLSSQSFGGVMTGEIIAVPFGTPTQTPSSVQFDGLTLGLTSSSLSDLEFLGILSSNSTAIGTVSVSNVRTNGAASSILGGLVLSQPTTGGDFFLDDSNGNLLLSGAFGNGSISGPAADNNASFTTDEVIFSDGSLLEFIEPEGSFVLSLILDTPSLQLNPVASDSTLAPFSADFTANITVLADQSDGQVPEPGSIFIFAPMLLGLVRRRRAAISV